MLIRKYVVRIYVPDAFIEDRPEDEQMEALEALDDLFVSLDFCGRVQRFVDAELEKINYDVKLRADVSSDD